MSQLQIDQVLAQIRALSGHLQPGGTQSPAGTQGAPSEFATMLRNGLEQVNQSEVRATQVADAFQRGAPGVELSQVMLEMQKASVSFRGLAEVRNRLVSAYQEIMNMSI
jgi:flagellar hook-basal body complex protein FliE